jgi:hypothetical protein
MTLTPKVTGAPYFEGRECPLAKLGYSRDGKRGTLQVIYGLTCDPDGRPVAIEAFDGAWHDDKTLRARRDLRTPRRADQQTRARRLRHRSRLQTAQTGREGIRHDQRPARCPSTPADLHARPLPVCTYARPGPTCSTTTPPQHRTTRSPAATRKAQTHRTPDRQPCHTLTSLLSELATRARNTIQPAGTEATFDQLTEATQLQAQALRLINELVPELT